MIGFHNSNTGETMFFCPGENDGEFTVISPDGANPADIPPNALKALRLYAEAKKVETDEDLEEFQKKLDEAFNINHD